MPLNTNIANEFTNSFMRGFSFVDDIRARKERQQKLDARLEEERLDRQRRRDREDVIHARQDLLFDQSQEDRERVENERALGREGDKVALSGSATREDLLPFIHVSQSARDKLASLVGEEQMLRDLETIQSSAAPARQIPTQTGGLSARASQIPGEVGATPINGESLLAPSRGRSGFQSVDLDDLQDPTAPDDLAGQALENLEGAGNRVTSSLRGLSVGAANLVQNFTGGPPAEGGANFAEAIGGNISVPEAYTTQEEFAQINDPAEFEARRKQNDEIVAQIKELGVQGDGQTRLDLLKAGDRKMRAEAQKQEFRVEQRYADFADPEVDSQFRELAAEDPHAAAIQYFNDRATLQSANPAAARAMDQQLQPTLQAAEATLQQTIAAAPAASPERARALRDLRSLQVTQSQIYSDYSPSEAAGINAQGLPIGNAELSGQVADIVTDPNRPRNATPIPGSQVRAAATTTNRMGNTRRATEAQMRAAIRLVDAGLASKEDLMTLTMTGSWPNDSGAAQIKSGKPGDVIYTIDNNGNYRYVTTLPGGKTSRPGSGKGGGTNTNQLSQDNLDQFRRGAMTMFPGDDDGTEEFLTALEGNLLDDSDWIQENFDLTDPIAANRIGRSYAAAVALSKAEDNIFPSWLGDHQPTAREIMRSPELAASLAAEHDIPMTALPEQRFDGINVNNLRQELQIEGKYPAALAQMANDPNVTDEELILTVARYDALRGE